MFGLNGKRVLVTGASAGIGQAIALGLAEVGAHVIAAGRSSCEQTVEQITAAGNSAQSALIDLSDGSFGVAAFEAMGDVDILVNNAGIIRRDDITDYSEQDWDDVVDVNQKAVFLLSQAFAKAVFGRNGKGKIVNIASLLSFQGGIRVPAYTASKHAVAGLTKIMANEWAARGINVNAIAPGYIATNNTKALRADKKRNAEILSRIPADRWGDPSDIAGAVAFLCAPASDYVHGAILNVDGGWLAR